MKQNRVLTQTLKPFSFQTPYGTVETVPHKDFLIATQALKPAPQDPVNLRNVYSIFSRTQNILSHNAGRAQRRLLMECVGTRFGAGSVAEVFFGHYH